MFKGARNFLVEGGSFIVNADSSKKVNLDRLIDLVAPNAILNAGGRADEVRCFPGTREEVISKVEDWMNGVKDGSCSNRITWLSGPAGAGKSAICQTIAERCPVRGQQAANFFFFRGDQTRNHAQHLVPTLFYQLRRLYPVLNELLTNYLEGDPLVFEASIPDQFLHVISSTMQNVHQSLSAQETIVLIIDGLDECADSRTQEQILTALRALTNADHSPFLVLVASRAEPHLIMSFNRLRTSIESIFLDDQYRPREDIRRFVVAKFAEIKQVHHLRELLSEHWPSESDIDAIIDKSSGQFIYAATVMRFIEHSPESPNLILVAILEMQPSAGHNPLAQLDAVYSYIFSRVRDIHSVKLILCASRVVDSGFDYRDASTKQFDFGALLQHIGYSAVVVQSLFANLGAIVRIVEYPLELVFYHASLHDYLRYQHRSGDYHLNMGEISAELSSLCLRNFHNTTSLYFAIEPLKFVTKATTELSESLLNASTQQFTFIKPYARPAIWPEFIVNIERLYFKTDRKLFKVLLQRWVRFSYRSHIEDRMSPRFKNTSASWYYRWYHVRAGLRLRLKNKL